ATDQKTGKTKQPERLDLYRPGAEPATSRPKCRAQGETSPVTQARKQAGQRQSDQGGTEGYKQERKSCQRRSRCQPFTHQAIEGNAHRLRSHEQELTQSEK